MKLGLAALLRRFSAVAVLACSLSLPALAQSPAPMPKNFETVDFNGVVLAPDGSSIRIPEPTISIGDPKLGGLSWSRFHQVQTNIVGSAINFDDMRVTQENKNNLWGQVTRCGSILPQYAASLGQSAESSVPGGGLSDQFTGAFIYYDAPGGEYTYTQGDGSVATYSHIGPYAACTSGLWGRVKSLVKPDGEVITWNYYVMPSGPYAGYWRLQSVTNNLNYQIHFTYQRDTAANATERDQWFLIQRVTAVDNTANPCAPTALTCDPNSGGSWPYLDYSYETGPAGANSVIAVTDRLGNKTKFLYSGNVLSQPNGGVHLTSYQSPAGANDDTALSFSPFRVTKAGVAWTYTIDGNGALAVAGPNGFSRTVTFTSGQSLPSYNYQMTARAPETDTLNGRTTTYTYLLDPYRAGVRLSRVTFPDQDYLEYSYDERRNVTHERRVAKPGSGLADIHLYASYPEATTASCVNLKTCNRPQWVTVPGPASGAPSSLPKTEYTYSSTHGVLLTETKPVPGSGPYAAVPPQTRYTYGDANTGIVRPTVVSTCRTTSSCTGTADETIVSTFYNAKRLPETVTTRAGDWSVWAGRTTTYTPQGDVASVDGPISGAADTVWTYYDTMRQPRVVVAPDPDGGGSLLYRATRTTYDADGQPILVEQGSVSAPSNCSTANSFCASAMTVLAKSSVAYDSFGRKVRESALNVSSGAAEAVKQYSYDNVGRVECVAVRMNSAVYGALPAACTQSTAGAFGQDQITRTAYTVNDDPSVIQTGYGTTLVRNERTFTYLAPGQVGTLKDAANNLSTYEYDGFDRLKKLRYPSLTKGAGTSSTTDYEEYGYNAAGNRTSERRRDGLMVANAYDTLGRLRTIDKPGAELDVTNSYDNFNNLISASQTGSSVTWAYDALGRVTSEAQGLGTVSYNYDAAGRRTQLTYPGSGFYVNYQYGDDSKLKLVGLNGATTGSDVLATYYDDQLGRRSSMCRGTGTSSSCSSVARTTYSYDAVSRLTGLAHDLTTGTSTYDASWTLAYSPASQLTSRTATSALYEWPYSATFSDAYTVNGLNQYTAVAGSNLAYDGRGNTTNDTTKTYTYDSSNKLTSASNGATLTYDPTGRLISSSLSGVTTKFLYDGTRLIGEYDGSNALLRRYVHGDGVDDPIVWFDSSGTTNRRNLFKDERGSVIAADTGSAVTSIKYDEYGNASVTGSNIPRFQYTGQAWMPEIGQYYYKARIYNPDLGRFMQTDPIGTKDQVNLYAYVGNDPFNKSDSSGLCPTCVWGGVIGGLVNGLFYHFTPSNEPKTVLGLLASVGEGAMVGAVVGSGAGIWTVGTTGATSHIVAEQAKTLGVGIATSDVPGAFQRKDGGNSVGEKMMSMGKDGLAGGLGAIIGAKVAPPIASKIESGLNALTVNAPKEASDKFVAGVVVATPRAAEIAADVVTQPATNMPSAGACSEYGSIEGMPRCQ